MRPIDADKFLELLDKMEKKWGPTAKFFYIKHIRYMINLMPTIEEKESK